MPQLSTGIMPTSIKTDPPGICHLLEIPLEIRDEIYRLLLTTTPCTHLASTGTALEFNLSKNILLASKRISVEASRVLLEENDFIVLKVTGLNLQLDNIPAFDVIPEHRVPNPVLRIEIQHVGERTVREENCATTVITTPEGLQPIITALWKLKKTGANSNIPYRTTFPYYPKDLSLSLTLNINKASVSRCKALKSGLLQPWELLHGIGKLSLVGDIEDSLRMHLENSMLQGPFHAEVASSLTKYHLLGQENKLQGNFSAAKWYWTIFEDYWRHLGVLRRDPIMEHEMKDSNSKDWNQLWIISKRMYYEAKLGIIYTFLRQSRYKEAILETRKVRYEGIWPLIDIEYTMSSFWQGKFRLCEAFAYTALGKSKDGDASRLEAAAHLRCHKEFGSADYGNVYKVSLFKRLEFSIDRELVNQHEVRPHDTEKEKRSIWDWLDIPE
jgi:hypothetical protein